METILEMTSQPPSLDAPAALQSPELFPSSVQHTDINMTVGIYNRRGESTIHALTIYDVVSTQVFRNIARVHEPTLPVKDPQIVNALPVTEFQPHQFVTTRTSSALVNIPTEILLQIFPHLGQVFSACLAVTCKDFYSLHRKLHGNVPLTTWSRHGTSHYQLGQLLSTWAGPNFIFHRPPHGAVGGLLIPVHQYEQFLQEEMVELERKDKIMKRVVESDLIEWESKIRWESRRRGSWEDAHNLNAWDRPWDDMKLKHNMKPWEVTCEKAKKAGFDLAWLGEKKVGGI